MDCRVQVCLLSVELDTADGLLCAGLSPEHATDVTALSAELDKVDGKLRELTTSSRTRYVTCERRDQLSAELTACVARKDDTQEHVERLRRHETVLRVALDAARTYLSVQLPHQTVADAVLLALKNTDILCGMLYCSEQLHFLSHYFGSFFYVKHGFIQVG